MSFERFMKKNVEQKANLRFAASERFTEEDGSPLMWEIKALTTQELQLVRKESTRKVKTNRGRKQEQVFDNELFTAKLAAACTVVPDLYNTELQNSYGVMTPEDLIITMLDAGEFLTYQNMCVDHMGLATDINDEVEEAKNS